MKIIDQQKLNQLSCEASTSPRRRKNLNVHDDYADPCQRLFNALEPGTYIRPHRHSTPPKPECFMAIRGLMVAIAFDQKGAVKTFYPFGPGCDVVAIEVPAGTWHTILSLETGSIFFEIKPGPFTPLTDKDFAPWAPEEGSEDVNGYLKELEMLVIKALADPLN